VRTTFERRRGHAMSEWPLRHSCLTSFGRSSTLPSQCCPPWEGGETSALVRDREWPTDRHCGHPRRPRCTLPSESRSR
jgi:hypothetical protein